MSPSARLTVVENFECFDRFARVIDREPDVSDVDQLCFHLRALRDLFDDKPRESFTQTALPRGAENDGQKDRASECFHVHHRLHLNENSAARERSISGWSARDRYFLGIFGRT